MRQAISSTQEIRRDYACKLRELRSIWRPLLLHLPVHQRNRMIRDMAIKVFHGKPPRPAEVSLDVH